MALDGDPVALRICMERIYPVRRGRALSFLLPPITSARDAADIAAAVAEAVASGKLTPSEAAEIGKVIRQGLPNCARRTDDRRRTDASGAKTPRPGSLPSSRVDGCRAAGSLCITGCTLVAR